MTTAAQTSGLTERVQTLSAWTSARSLGRDTPRDFVLVVAAFAVFAALDRWTGRIATVEAADLERVSLTWAAAGNRWWLLLALLVLAGAGFILRPTAMLARWSDLEHGQAIRTVAVVLCGLLAWQASLYSVNFIAGRVHGIDRLLVVALALAVAARPVAIVPFVLQVRIVNEQFLHPFDTSAAKNNDELLLLALLAVAASHVILVLTGRNNTSATVLITSAAVATHFFVPGRGKMAGDWLRVNDVADLPLSSWTAGWLGHTDGAVPQAIGDFFTTFRLPVLVITLLIEVGAIIGVVHPKLFQFWLGGYVVFHAMTFATTGFFFLGWTLLELALLVAVAAPRFRPLVVANATPARGLLAAAAVLAGTVLFHPPGLAWFDAPVSYGYRIEATGLSGASYHVPISALAPYEQDVSFIRLQLADRPTASGGYGSVTTEAALQQLRAIDDFDSLEAYERTLGPPPATESSAQFFVAFFDHVNSGDRRRWLGLSPPGSYWTSREEPVFDFDEPLERLDVFLLVAIHRDDGRITELRPVLTVEADEAGVGVVTATTP